MPLSPICRRCRHRKVILGTSSEGRNVMTRWRFMATAGLAIAAMVLPSTNSRADDAILSGTVVSSSGEKMGGVTVSAKPEGGTITTSVFTDESGAYYFPPMPAAKYRVWAQALSYKAAKSSIDLPTTERQDFLLKPMQDFVRQLPGDVLLAALPGDTAEDFRMKTQVRKNCTGCHSASYPLQHKFDEAGWNAILDLMKHVNVLGNYLGPDHKGTPNIEFHQKELAAYLARARGPGESSMKIKLDPRPSGEAARAVFKEYDFPKEDGADTASNDGSDWSLGTPSELNGMVGAHDAQADFDGNLWITYSLPSYDTTIARIDAKTGAVQKFRLDDVTGFAAGTLDVDLKGHVWVTAPDGALRFDIEKETFTEFKSITYKNQHGTATVYGIAVDREGNGWWALMSQDLIDYSDIATGKTSELKLPPEPGIMENLTPEQRKMYETFVAPDFNAPFAWAQGPRRLGADKNGDFVWIGDSFGGTLGRIDIRTKEVTLVPLPNPEALQPYQVQIDSDHNVWTNLWSSDRIAKYDPSASQWTLFDLPTRGTETRYISLLERDGKLQVILPYYRTRKVAVMTVRSKQELEALKIRAGGQ